MEKISCFNYRDIKVQENLQIQGQLLSWQSLYTGIQINRLIPICPGKSAALKLVLQTKLATWFCWVKHICFHKMQKRTFYNVSPLRKTLRGEKKKNKKKNLCWKWQLLQSAESTSLIKAEEKWWEINIGLNNDWK